ncbi:MAG: hypothetical protein AABW86_04325 [Candidatus Micrarchaeota archaeon]
MDFDSQFFSTAKILLGKEIGQLSECQEYLSEMVEKPLLMRSAISGKDVYLSRKYYSREAGFVSLDEIDKQATPAINVNDIKDIDSIRSAISERLYYCGNSNIGNCVEVEQSDACNDAAFTLASHQVIRSKNVAYTYGARECENVYGCMLVGEVRFAIRTQVTFKSVRCLEAYLSINSSDLFFSFNCRSCHDALFSFNQTSKRNIIGNNELPKEKYLVLKAKLIAEIADELARNKKFPSLFEIAGPDT